jgi:hypothetical protein
MRIMNAKDNEALVLLGDAAGKEVVAVADFCQLVTRRGKITVGISGVDNYVQETGFWKRLSEMFFLSRGNCSRSRTIAPLS